MTHDEVAELLGVYALDAIDADDVVGIEDHLRDCARCRAEVAEHRETAALLAHASADAPPALWDRIAGSIDQPGDVVPFASRLGARPRRLRVMPSSALLAAAAALVIAVLGLQVRHQDQRIDSLSTAMASAPAAQLASAMAEPGSHVVELSTTDGYHLPVVLTSAGRGFLQAAQLPALHKGETYQLWGIAGDQMVSVGVLGRDPGVIAFDADGYAELAITAEHAPGVVQSTKDPIASGDLA